jgi:transcriptional regulator with XRE-family HTH domain
MAWLDTGKRVALSKRMRREMAAKGWTQAKLAKAAGYDERTIRNVLKAESTRPDTILDICETLGIEFDCIDHAASDLEHAGVAAEEYGAYARKSVGDYVGSYFGYRRAFSKSRKIMRTCFTIDWSKDKGRLTFSEYQEYVPLEQGPSEPHHGGDLYIGANTNLVHLVTIFQGAVRLVTLTKMRNQVLRGVVLTQGERPAFYQPAVSALLLKKVEGPLDERSFHARIGALTSDDPEYQRVNSELREIEAEVIFFAQSQDA